MRKLAILLDPDKPRTLVPKGADVLLVGGSTMAHPELLSDYVRALKRDCPGVPVYLFPGSALQFTPEADGMLFLALISGRNPDYLIGEQVKVSLEVKKSGIDVLPTGYILLDGGTHYTTLKVTHTEPLLMTDIDAIVRTAVAGELMGMRYIYLEAGSGALHPVSEVVIRAVRAAIDVPLIVGGGLRTREAIEAAYEAGADVVVVGNHLERHPEDLASICK